MWGNANEGVVGAGKGDCFTFLTCFFSGVGGKVMAGCCDCLCVEGKGWCGCGCWEGVVYFLGGVVGEGDCVI